MFSMISAGRNRFLVGICLLTMSGCSSLSQRPPSCDGSARHPLNGMLYDRVVDSSPEMVGQKYPPAIDSMAKGTTSRTRDPRIGALATPVIPAASSSSHGLPAKRTPALSADGTHPLIATIPPSLEPSALRFADPLPHEKPVSIRTSENFGDKS